MTQTQIKPWSKPGTTKPGEFKSYCRLGHWVSIEKLFEVAPDTTQSRWDSKLGCNVFLVQCDFETAEPAAYAAHMLEVHDRKLGTYEGVTGKFTQRFPRQVPKPGRGMWAGPRLSDEGRPFEPDGLEPGATVTWSELVGTGETYYDEELHRTVELREWVERSGQVWSKGWVNRSVWVIPFEKREGEAAVLVCENGGKLRHHSTYKTSAPRAA